MTKKKKKEQKPEERILFPGDRVDLQSGVTAIIYPMGFSHIKSFSKDIAGALMQMGSFLSRRNVPKEQVAKALLGEMIPYVLGNLLGLVEATVRLEPEDVVLEDLPHWELAPIVEQWIETNFGEEHKIRPWIAAIEGLLNRFTDEPISLWEMVSKPLSPPDTDLETSSTEDSQVSLTTDGPSSSSNSGSDAPTDTGT